MADAAPAAEAAEAEPAEADAWPRHALGEKWGTPGGAPTALDPCGALQRGRLPDVHPPRLAPRIANGVGRMGRMHPPPAMHGADDGEQQVEEEELDARLLQTAAAEQPACELCGQRDSLPLQGPLSGPYSSAPLRLPMDGSHDKALLRSSGWAHTWCVHYAVSTSTGSRPLGTLAGDAAGAVVGGHGHRAELSRAASAIRKGQRTNCGVCWRPGATVRCGAAGCELHFHLGCARWRPQPTVHGVECGPLALGAVRCARHMDDVGTFSQWRDSLEVFVLAEHPTPAAAVPANSGVAVAGGDGRLPPTLLGEQEQGAAEEQDGSEDGSAAAAPMEGAHDAVAGSNPAALAPPAAAAAVGISADPNAIRYAERLARDMATLPSVPDPLATPTEAERRCDAAGGAAAAAGALLREARARQRMLRNAEGVGGADYGESVARMTPLVRGAIGIVCTDHLLLDELASHQAGDAASSGSQKRSGSSSGSSPEHAVTPPAGAGAEVSMAVQNGAKRLVRVAESVGAWQGGGSNPGSSSSAGETAVEAAAGAFAAAAKEAVVLSEAVVKSTAAKSKVIEGQKQELESISGRLAAEAAAEQAAREAVATLERQLDAARTKLAGLVGFNENLRQIRSDMESKVVRQESDLGDAVKIANEALDGARRDEALLVALNQFATAFGGPLLARRSTELQEHLEATVAQLASLSAEAAAYHSQAVRVGFLRDNGSASTLGRIAGQFFTSGALRIEAAAAVALESALLVRSLMRWGAFSVPADKVDDADEQLRSLSTFAQAVVTDHCAPLLKAAHDSRLAEVFAAGNTRGKRKMSDDGGGSLLGYGLNDSLQEDATKSLAPQGVCLLSGGGMEGSHPYTEVVTELLRLLALRLVWAGSTAAATKPPAPSEAGAASTGSFADDEDAKGGHVTNQLTVVPQRSTEAQSWAALLGNDAISLLCNAVDAAVVGPPSLTAAQPKPPAVVVLPGRSGGAAALPLSAALVWRYLKLRHPAVKRIAVVHGVSAGSAASVLATNRRLLADWHEDTRQLMVTVLLEGGAGAAAGGLQMDPGGSWDWNVSKNEDVCIKNEGFRIKNEELCI